MNFQEVCKKIWGDKVYIGPVPQEFLDAMKMAQETEKINYPIGHYTYLVKPGQKPPRKPVYTAEELRRFDNELVWVVGGNNKFLDDNFNCVQCGQDLQHTFAWGLTHGNGFCEWCNVGYMRYWYPVMDKDPNQLPRLPLKIWAVNSIPMSILEKNGIKKEDVE